MWKRNHGPRAAVIDRNPLALGPGWDVMALLQSLFKPIGEAEFWRELEGFGPDEGVEFSAGEGDRAHIVLRKDECAGAMPGYELKKQIRAKWFVASNAP